MLHPSRDQHVRRGHLRSVGRRGVQLGEVDVGRLELQGRGLVRRWRQPPTMPSPRHQHRVAVLMGMMPVIVLMRVSRLTTTYRAGTPRALLQTGRPVVASLIHAMDGTRCPRGTRRGAPRTWRIQSLKTLLGGFVCADYSLVILGDSPIHGTSNDSCPGLAIESLKLVEFSWVESESAIASKGLVRYSEKQAVTKLFIDSHAGVFTISAGKFCNWYNWFNNFACQFANYTSLQESKPILEGRAISKSKRSSVIKGTSIFCASIVYLSGG